MNKLAERDTEDIFPPFMPSKKIGGSFRPRSFLDPYDSTFSRIRKRLSRLKLNVDYTKGLDNLRGAKINPLDRKYKDPSAIKFQRDHHDVFDNGRFTKRKPNLPYPRGDILREDTELRLVRKRINSLESNKPREGSSTSLRSRRLPPLPPRPVDTAPRLSDEGKLTATNSEFGLQSKPLRLTDRIDGNVRIGPSAKTPDKPNRVHMGLMESLDLGEKLDDLDKIKERYSNAGFIRSLALHKMRGHDKCFDPDIHVSEHIPTGTKLKHPDSQAETAESRLSPSTDFSIALYSQRDGKSSPVSQRTGFSLDTGRGSPNSFMTRQSPSSFMMSKRGSRRKVEFDLTASTPIASPKKDEDASPNSTMSLREIRPILKKKYSKDSLNNFDTASISTDKTGLSTKWRFQLPPLDASSPIQSCSSRNSSTFRRNMFQYGDGISHEFQEVVDRYGNCRQPSMVKEASRETLTLQTQAA